MFRHFWWVVLIALIALIGCDPFTDLLIEGDSDAQQGIVGTVTIYPGVCLGDPENPDICLNPPHLGSGTFDIRRFADKPDLGFDSPILVTFTSSNDGLFQIGLPAGTYCVWWLNDCQAQVIVPADEWAFVSLGVFLP